MSKFTSTLKSGKIKIVGDIHGGIHSGGPINNVSLVSIFEETPSDHHIISVGDLGFSETYQILNKHLSENPQVQFSTIMGNHDHYDRLTKYDWFIENGTVSVMDDGRKIMFIGGASSIDRHSRIEDYSWFKTEQLSMQSLYTMIDVYEVEKPDIIISHTFPHSFIELSNIMPNLTWYGDATSDGGCVPHAIPRTELTLEQMFQSHQPQLWIGGHWHKSASMIYNSTRFIILNEHETLIM